VKPSFDLLLGTRTLLSRIEWRTSSKAEDFFTPNYLAPIVRQSHPGASVNKGVTGRCFLINSLISPRDEIWNFLELSLRYERTPTLYCDSTGNIVFGISEEANEELFASREKKSSSRKTGTGRKPVPSDLDQMALLRYPWELIQENAGAIVQDYSTHYSNSRAKSRTTGNFEVRGERVFVSEKADIERYVTLDARKGPVIVEDDVTVQSHSHLTGPCFIDKMSTVKFGKVGHGTTVGSNCKVSGEVEESIISGYTNKSHEGYLGHSLVGSWVNLGALTTNSDLKNTYGKITVNVGRKPVNTNLIKVGVFIGDMAKTAIGTLIISGKKIGVAAQVFGTVLEDVASFTMYAKSLGAKSAEIFIDSAVQTQKRVMERRGLSMTDAEVALLRAVFKMTSRERTFQEVAKRRFKLD
jgi:UDP-N-acetylglucosamine diphosphorylase / glucose-1-phosphate thymidylyltransferase / UDP-N-acetylgalactosamine diphosphorylase / glucosamine-1-phosphate N-acetyltransferase / galactosamine-1-phosphate N-acetyltransferase